MDDNISKNGSVEIEKFRLETRNKELDIESKRIKYKYGLSEQGLKNGSVGVGLSFFIVLVLIVGAFFANQTVFSGWHIVTIIFIIIFGLVSFFSLVFWREIKLAAELSEKGAKIDVGTGSVAKDA